MHKIAAWALAALVVASSGSAASLREVGPQASAAQIITARGPSDGPVLRLIYDVTGSARTTVDIAPDYVLVRHDGDPKALLTDYRLKRMLEIDGAQKVFSNSSLYEDVDFRYRESFNRRYLRKVMGETMKAKRTAFNSFWDQQELGLVPPEDETTPVERRATESGGLALVVDGRIASSFEPSSQTISADEMQGVLRFLHSQPLHPMLLAAIKESGRLPSGFHYWKRFGDKQEQWTLVSVERVHATFPLTAGLRPELLTEGGTRKLGTPLSGLLPLMLGAVSGTSRPRSVESYRAALADLRAKGNVLQHNILDNEFALQYGLGTMGCLSKKLESGDCAAARETLNWWATDPKTYALMESFGMEEKGDRKGAIARRMAVSRDGLADPYMLDLWIANAMDESGEGDALPLLANAIRGNPFVGGFYNDLGEAFMHRFMPTEAWICYDLALALPSSDDMPVVDGLKKKKDFLESTFPEFF